MGGSSNGQVMQRLADEKNRAAMSGALDGKKQPPSMPELIGQAVALHLAPIVQTMAQHMAAAAMPDCFACVRDAAQLLADYQVAIAVAQRAAEPVPGPPKPPEVRKAVTWVPVAQVAQTPAGPATFGAAVPMCFQHVPAGGGQSAPVSVGLVDLAGNPISYRRGA